MSDIFEQLRAPFAPELISWRVGSTTKDKAKGMALAYIDARDVMSRLDDVVGPANWQDRYEFHGPRTVCYLSIRIDGGWVTKADGAGDSDVEAEKGAISDALKRSAVKWGIGRYIYDLPAPWVKLNDFKGIDPGELPGLRALLARNAGPVTRQPALPPPAEPSAAVTIAAAALSDSLPRAQVAEMASVSNAEWTERLSASEARNRALEEVLSGMLGAFSRPLARRSMGGHTLDQQEATLNARQALQGTTEPQGLVPGGDNQTPQAHHE